jgi:hypothetical protein
MYFGAIELLQFLIVKSHGESLMEKEICFMDSCTTNSILRKTKHFQTLTRRSENVLTIIGRDATIVHSGRATIVTPPSRNDGVNQDHVEGFLVKREFTGTCIQAIVIVF